MDKSIEDYRRELMDMAMRGGVGGRELFAEDSQVETMPPRPTQPTPPQMPPQPIVPEPMPPQTRPTIPEPMPPRPAPKPPTPPQVSRPIPPRPTTPQPTQPQPMPPRPIPPVPPRPQPSQTRPVPVPPPSAPELSASGTLVVALTHSKGLFPVPNARVCVSDSLGNNLGCKQTDASGRTDEWRLSAPPKANSASPGSSNVSAFYNLRIDADGYVPVIIEGVPIFDGVRTLQPLDMFFAGAAPSTAPEVIKFNNSYTL